MPYLNMKQIGPESGSSSPAILDGVHFAQESVQFAALGIIARDKEWSRPQYHLFALAIELAFKSLALRSGASVDDCRKACHRTSAMIKLIEENGTVVPDRLKQRLSDDEWFKSFLMLSRYPVVSAQNTSIDNTLFLHSDYPEMIAEILETPCKWPLDFEHGSALAEFRSPCSSRRRIAVDRLESGTKTGAQGNASH